MSSPTPSPRPSAPEHLQLAAPLEAKVAEAGGDLGALSDEEKATLEGLRKAISGYQESVGTVGITLFKQIDADKRSRPLASLSSSLDPPRSVT